MRTALLVRDDALTIDAYLHPGQIYCTSEASMVSTLLGSCVAVSLWDPIALVGGMNHFLLPLGHGPRYASDSLPELLSEMIGRGASVSRLVAKVFGGACVLNGFSGAGRAIGAQNIEAALQFLAEQSIAVHAEHTGGLRGRKVLFHTGTGCAYVKELG